MDRNEELFEVTAMFRMFLKRVSQDWKKQGHGINITQFKVLFHLVNEGPQKVSQIANALSLSSAAVTGITDQLLNEGYVRKEREKNDRRVVTITIIEKGKFIVKNVLDGQQKSLQSYFERLSEEDIQQLKRIFGVLVENI
ncbi:MAG: MarR family winged helix-turn-helix transcriptional regulator [Bacillaceae bacterium]